MTEPRPGDIFQPGVVLNNTYRIEAVLGRGGTSEVYRARNEISGRAMAVKVLKSEFARNADFLLLMTREEEMREIRHDAVVRYSENHRTPDGQVYLIMDYVEGPGLHEKLRQGGLDAEQLLVIGARVAQGLRAAHDRKIFHRDLSPDNIILRGGDPAQAVIIDFGIAKDANAGAATIVGGEFAGKYAYAAPEQLHGHADARSDIYALGALLLATFRGAAPDAGNSPMEVLRRKAEPLDTEGVPEPLKSLLDRMTAPDPADRFQSAEELLEAIDPAGQQTRVMPRDTVAPPARPPRRRGRGGPALAALLALTVLGGGAWFGGLFEPRLPAASPFVLIAERDPSGALTLAGHAPSEETAAALSRRVAAAGGASELDLASGEIAVDWGPSVVEVLDAALPLKRFRLRVQDDTMSLDGITHDPVLRDRLLAMLDGAAAPGALEGRVEIALEPSRLTRETLQPLLDDAADCGPLQLADMPADGYPAEAPITVRGQLAEIGDRIGLYDAILAVADGRPLAIETEVLNPALCLIEQHLPQAPEGGFNIAFSFGATGSPNTSGRFFVGENPVIDVALPPGATQGYVYASILDVTGNVYHLLPNVNRPDNAVATLRHAADGTAAVRVAYPVASAETDGGLAFLVDDSLLGKSKVIVLHAAAPIFDELRPTTESAEAYAAALQARADLEDGLILSLDSRLLTTARP